MSRAPNWTAEEDRVIAEHYPTGGAAACRPHLTARSGKRITQRAYNLGIRAPSNRPSGHYAPDGVDEVLRVWAARRHGATV